MLSRFSWVVDCVRLSNSIPLFPNRHCCSAAWFLWNQSKKPFQASLFGALYNNLWRSTPRFYCWPFTTRSTEPSVMTSDSAAKSRSPASRNHFPKIPRKLQMVWNTPILWAIGWNLSGCFHFFYTNRLNDLESLCYDLVHCTHSCCWCIDGNLLCPGWQRFLWLLRVSEVVTIAIVSVFRKWVSNNRIYLRANQHTKLAKVRTPRTLRWFPDSSRWRTKYSGLSWSVEPMSVLEDYTMWGEFFFFNILQHLLLAAFIFCFWPTRWTVTWLHFSF
mgnify:CR=1 FL=1